ncbi:MAG TPA: TadE/TadG family type IV pilus assembly protein [Actinomycetota bacterium]|nr:TadE/TadG family type IV pilus assembly protein [Actinomycetota bacterium]
MAALRPVHRLNKLLRREEGAEAVEFALVGPMVLFLVFGVIYMLLLAGAQLSLGYATNVAVRYAAIPVSGTTYPSASQVVNKVDSVTPYFTASSSTPSLAAGGVNQPVTLTMDCDFPNPAGRAANALRNAFVGNGEEISSTIELSATARSRRE